MTCIYVKNIVKGQWDICVPLRFLRFLRNPFHLQLFYVLCVIKGIITHFRSKYGNLSMYVSS